MKTLLRKSYGGTLEGQPNGVLMKMLGSGNRLVLVASIGALMMISQAQAAVSCHKINAHGVGQDLGGGVTHATIKGGGLLHGTTVGNFTITGISPPVASFAGTVEFTDQSRNADRDSRRTAGRGNGRIQCLRSSHRRDRQACWRDRHSTIRRCRGLVYRRLRGGGYWISVCGSCAVGSIAQGGAA